MSNFDTKVRKEDILLMSLVIPELAKFGIIWREDT